MDYGPSPNAGDYALPDIAAYSPSLQATGMNLSGFQPASFDMAGQQPYTFSDVMPGAELLTASPSTLDVGGNFAINSMDNPYLKMAMSDVGNTSYGSPEAQIAVQSGEAIDAGGGNYLVGSDMVDANSLQGYLAGIRGGLGGNGLGVGAGEAGLRYDPVHALGGGLGTEEDSLYGLRTGALDSKGYMGFEGPDGDSLGQGLKIAGAPSRPMSLSDLQLLDENPNATLDAWGKNQDLSWSDYAKQNGYDPFDLGTDAISLLGGKIANMGYGGSGGSGAGVPGSAQQLAKAVAANEKAATSGGTNAKGNSPGSQAVRDLASTAAMLAALLGSGDKKSPKSSQGDIGANAWNVARMKSRGQAPARFAEGGSVLAKIRELYKQYGPEASRTEYRRQEESRPDPRQLILEDPGMMQDAARAISGRQRQLDELERRAVGNYAMGGPVMGQLTTPATGRLVRHASGGQADKVDAQLSGGEFIVPSDVVADLGDGNTDNGALKLYSLMKNVRKHKGKPNKLPPAAKESVQEYMK
jgi:hypothetical protein